jgi:hypothetical protein
MDQAVATGAQRPQVCGDVVCAVFIDVVRVHLLCLTTN